MYSPNEVSSAQGLSSALFDLRRVLTGTKAAPEQMAGHPAMVQMMKDARTLALEKSDFEDLVRNYIAPNSWDEDPRTHLLMGGCPTLLVIHSPWVLDDIEALIEALR